MQTNAESVFAYTIVALYSRLVRQLRGDC